MALIVLSGCPATVKNAPEAPAVGVTAVPRVETPARPVVTQLTAEAGAALQNAEILVAQAGAQRALWPAAAQALQQARVAARTLDSPATLQWAAQAAELARLGLLQRNYPPVRSIDESRRSSP